MMKPRNSWIRLKETIDRADAEKIRDLERLCVRADGVAFKLELDYKLGMASGSAASGARTGPNELMYFDGDLLVGYLGICCFGGEGATPEAMGMVRPDYRRQGIFSALAALARSELKRRAAGRALLLSDGRSASGLGFIEKTGAVSHHSEYEMYLREGGARAAGSGARVILRKAVNADAPEVARQDAIYFGSERGAALVPEEEAARGMTIYLAEWAGKVVGKVHLQLLNGLGGVYGLGVLPEYRGKGLGRAILLEGIGCLKAAGAGEVMLQVVTENENALRLYESCGFERTSVMRYYSLIP